MKVERVIATRSAPLGAPPKKTSAQERPKQPRRHRSHHGQGDSFALHSSRPSAASAQEEIHGERPGQQSCANQQQHPQRKRPWPHQRLGYFSQAVLPSRGPVWNAAWNAPTHSLPTLPGRCQPSISWERSPEGASPHPTGRWHGPREQSGARSGLERRWRPHDRGHPAARQSRLRCSGS